MENAEERWEHAPADFGLRSLDQVLHTLCAHLERPQLAVAGIAAVVTDADDLPRGLAPAVQQDQCQALAVARQDDLRPQWI